MNICVIGTGYVGLVTGCVFSDLGNEVICVDNNPDKIAMLERGEMPIYEPGLEELVKRNVDDHRLSFTSDAAAAVEHSDVVFICVGTPRASHTGGDETMPGWMMIFGLTFLIAFLTLARNAAAAPLSLILATLVSGVLLVACILTRVVRGRA